MTIIIASSGIMAADSIVTSGSMMARVAFPKIIRLADGRLVGAAGYAGDCWSVMEWFRSGEPDRHPDFIGKPGDNDIDILIMKHDGSVWRNTTGLKGFYPAHDGTAIGSSAGCYVVETAMYLGYGAASAVGIAIKLVAGLGGEVQVERFHPVIAKAAE